MNWNGGSSKYKAEAVSVRAEPARSAGAAASSSLATSRAAFGSSPLAPTRAALAPTTWTAASCDRAAASPAPNSAKLSSVTMALVHSTSATTSALLVQQRLKPTMT